MSESDRVKSGLRKVIEHFLRPTDYHALYPGKVVAQNSSGNLDVVPDDSRLPGMQDVPIRYGIPCVTATVREGSRVLIGFENGNPKSPIATLWDSADIQKIIVAPDKFYIGTDGANAWPIARMGDMVECYLTVSEIIAAVAPGATPPAVIKLPGIIQSGASKGFTE